MESIPVTNSSNIANIAYDGGILTIDFTTASKYQYYGVPLDKWREFKLAASKGQYFAANIKGQYESQRVR